MATRARTDGQDVVQDAKHVLQKLGGKDAKAALAAVEKGRKKKLLDAAWLKKHAQNVATLGKALGKQRAASTGTGGATRAEEKARAALAAALVDLRDDVTLTDGVPDAVAKAFGRGAVVDKNSTPRLLEIADAAAAAYEDDDDAKRAAKEAGVTPARMKKLAQLASKLRDADTTQSTLIGARRAGTSGKNALQRAVQAGTARIRKVVKRALRGKPAVLKQFATTVARRTPKKRPSKTATTGTTTTTS